MRVFEMLRIPDEVEPCNECGFPSKKPVCDPCQEQPDHDLPGIPMVLVIVLAVIVLGLLFWLAVKHWP